MRAVVLLIISLCATRNDSLASIFFKEAGLSGGKLVWRTENLHVGGSIPPLATKHQKDPFTGSFRICNKFTLTPLLSIENGMHRADRWWLDH